MEPPPPEDSEPEQRIIARLLASGNGPHSVVVGPGDDAAVLPDGSVWTLDTLVEGVHFDKRLTPADVGYKCVAVSVSDLAAMGAEPKHLLLGLSVGRDGDDAFVEGFAQGLGDALEHFGVTLVGGDTTRSGPTRVVTTSLGGTLVGEPLLRSGARAGDRIWITGRLGLAGEGWSAKTPSASALRALRRPDPPLAFALALARQGLATAAMDLSDGLGADLPRMCRASGVGARVEPDAIPGVASLRLRVHGGDDFQLLFAAPPQSSEAVLDLAREHRVAATQIGVFTADPELVLVGAPWPAPMFTHFVEKRK
ncbi:MAG: thiamine-phosphate kinase [Myxococcota bacterium]